MRRLAGQGLVGCRGSAGRDPVLQCRRACPGRLRPYLVLVATHERPWWIAVANMCGSVAFGAAAVASYVVPDSGALRNAMVVNLGTCLGALCFLVGAYLLLPRSPVMRTLTIGGTPA